MTVYNSIKCKYHVAHKIITSYNLTVFERYLVLSKLIDKYHKKSFYIDTFLVGWNIKLH